MRLDLERERERAENKMWIESSNPSEEKSFFQDPAVTIMSFT